MGTFLSGPKHTMWAGPWHHCARCDRKSKIARMRWQRGLFLCPKCYDDWPLEGQRESAIARILEDGAEELVPVEKLRDPTIFEDEADFNI